MTPQPGSHKMKCEACNQKLWNVAFDNGEAFVCKRCIVTRRLDMEDAVKAFIESVTSDQKDKHRPYSMLELFTSLNAIQGLLAQTQKPAQSGKESNETNE
ncbi:hypothetical protein PSEUBRA_001097 [Kalmanozyma brasiliensis GHG001]|uniref:uncharacterized protein n=1 Tax=Kalmanozyma brasiliensis (strain GHG001) TaxID=1365824 RepID=UPI00286831EA|nr:uncharacterized protein PSEUBRA_001097 [Kalmanozyma brasiliensis GHG001]KAF6766889.1 hypothetical protein PSEUBRA_001097 [Kalmanozyma brasiliensis GHG001]